MPEARLERTENGLLPEGDGWLVLNAREAPWQPRVAYDGFEVWRGPYREGDLPFT